MAASEAAALSGAVGEEPFGVAEPFGAREARLVRPRQRHAGRRPGAGEAGLRPWRARARLTVGDAFAPLVAGAAPPAEPARPGAGERERLLPRIAELREGPDAFVLGAFGVGVGAPGGGAVVMGLGQPLAAADRPVLAAAPRAPEGIGGVRALGDEDQRVVAGFRQARFLDQHP